MRLAELLADLRQARGLSQEELAARAAVSVRAISDVERGATRRPHRETIRALAEGLALGPAERELFERAARQAPPPSTRRRTARQVTLPAPTSSIVGRAEDITAVARLLRDPGVRLVTVTGPGGIGKTRLAAEVGWRESGAFDRVHGVDLSTLHRPDDVAATLVTSLGCRTGGGAPVEAIAVHVGDARWLLVLDSFEHVAAAAADLAHLLAACPRLHALVTSRSPLRLRGEHLWPLPPLPTPARDTADPDKLAQSPAVTLLVERTRAVRPGFALSTANAAPLAWLCRRLDGLPLAIELAAAHLRTQEPAELVAQLRSRFTELRADTVDLPDRHQTLRRTVEWSSQRLAPPDRLLLGVIAVFAGASPAALRTVLAAAPLRDAGLDPAALAPSLTVLSACSLVTVADRAGQARVAMLDTIREIALDLLTTAGLDQAARHAHARYFLDVARAASGAPDSFDHVDRDLDNVRTALAWTAGHEPEALDVPLARALTGYFTGRGHFAEARQTLRTLAEATVDDGARAYALTGAGIAANEDGDHEAAIRYAERAAELFEKLDDPSGRCTALTLTGNAYKHLGRYEPAHTAHQTCLALAQAAGDLRRVTIARNNLGTLAHDRGDHEAARIHYSTSLRIKQDLGDRRGIAIALMNLGGLDNDLGRFASAHQQLHEAVAMLRELNDCYLVGFSLALRAEAELGLGEPDTAHASATEALRIARDAEYQPAIGLALARLGDLALARSDPPAAERYYQEALDHTRGAPETARTLEHLAAARATTAPAEARRLLDTAADLRRSHQTPAPPVDAALIRAPRAAGDGPVPAATP